MNPKGGGGWRTSYEEGTAFLSELPPKKSGSLAGNVGRLVRRALRFQTISPLCRFIKRHKSNYYKIQRVLLSRDNKQLDTHNIYYLVNILKLYEIRIIYIYTPFVKICYRLMF